MNISQGKYNILKNIRTKGQSLIKLASNTSTSKKVILKLEDRFNSKDSLEHEMRILHNLRNLPGIPVVLEYGREPFYNFLALSRLGVPLSKPKVITSLSQLAYLACQAIQILKHIHSSGYLYCNLKPCHMILGRGSNKSHLYFLDFKNARWISNSKIEGKDVLQDPVYASLNSLAGLEVSKRDDLESLCYCLIALHNSKLPWDRNKLNLPHIIYLSKLGMTIDKICAKCPAEFAIFMKYCRSLSIEERPDYDYLIDLMKKIIEHQPLDKTYNLSNLSKLLHKRNRKFLKHFVEQSETPPNLYTNPSSNKDLNFSSFVRSKHVDSHEYSSTSPKEIETSKSELPNLSIGMRKATLNLSRIY